MNKKSGMMSFSILMLSLLPMSTGATSSTIPGLMKQFPAVSSETAELTVTIPSFTMAVVIILSSLIVKRIGTKKLVLAGTALTAFGAGLSMFSPSVAVLLIARAIMGAGIGAFNTLCISLIDRLYSGQQRERMLGFQNTFQGLGAAGGALGVGLILMYSNWRMAFGIYLISVVLFVLYLFYVPEVRYDNDDPQTVGQADEKVSWMSKLQFGYYWIVMFILMVFYMTVNVKMPTYILNNHFGALSVGSTAVVVMSIGTIIGGLIYGFIESIAKNATLVMAIAIEAVGVFMISTAGSALACFIGAFTVGFSFGLFIPFIFSKGLSFVPKKYGNDATTILMISTNGANFLCPYVSKFINIGGTDRSLFMMSGVIASILGIIELVKLLANRPRRTVPEA
ncbi:MFS transporter [Lentilactobacillus buchneri]|uniref:MFS transporter n=1 Tax=Lentilactobacillus buchneri TaxID=1581 RepID=UPI001292051A|nr:MFS transporter [Lentilactobacillus buchneri]MQM76769.1 MFS transporter [Lentilactobacillus buchneri]MQM86792.1 MFS transporter [Lentilactobacillus buchneri]MQN21267.1 MFS transporter [Lentilactobacillus buchneri]